jgi:hypothetical protein
MDKTNHLITYHIMYSSIPNFLIVKSQMIVAIPQVPKEKAGGGVEYFFWWGVAFHITCVCT